VSGTEPERKGPNKDSIFDLLGLREVEVCGLNAEDGGRELEM
jgi:hypothetical protein